MSAMDYEEKSNKYRQILAEYTEAMQRELTNIVELFDRAAVAWAAVCSMNGYESDIPEMHLVLAFSSAVGTYHRVEAERIYNLMSPEQQLNVDRLEAYEPGKYKIWVNSP